MTNSDMKTKKFPCVHQTGTGKYRSICGRYKVWLSTLHKHVYYVTLRGVLTHIYTDLDEVHCYIEGRHPELRSRLCQLLMTDN